MNIPESLKKLKGLGSELLLPAIVVLVGVSAFALGRLSVTEEHTDGLRITYPPFYEETLPATAGAARVTSGGEGTRSVVASKNGSKYFSLTCPSAKSISEANKIVFPSEEEARRAGYTPAATCKDLQ